MNRFEKDFEKWYNSKECPFSHYDFNTVPDLIRFDMYSDFFKTVGIDLKIGDNEKISGTNNSVYRLHIRKEKLESVIKEYNENR